MASYDNKLITVVKPYLDKLLGLSKVYNNLHNFKCL